MILNESQQFVHAIKHTGCASAPLLERRIWVVKPRTKVPLAWRASGASTLVGEGGATVLAAVDAVIVDVVAVAGRAPVEVRFGCENGPLRTAAVTPVAGLADSVAVGRADREPRRGEVDPPIEAGAAFSVGETPLSIDARGAGADDDTLAVGSPPTTNPPRA